MMVKDFASAREQTQIGYVFSLLVASFCRVAPSRQAGASLMRLTVLRGRLWRDAKEAARATSQGVAA